MKYLYPLLLGILFTYSCSKDSNDGDDPKIALLEACFEISKDTLSVGENLQLTNCSKGATSYAYNFGNGKNSTEESPVTTFENGGDFNISLTVTNDEMETKTFSREVHVTSATSKYIYPDIATGFSAVSLETGINPV